MANVINVDKLAVEVLENLRIYEGQTIEMVEQAVLTTANETVQKLKKTSPVGSTGDYAKSWAHKRDPNIKGKYRFSRVVYSKKPDYRLTHLLECGHAKVNGGRVPGQPHIKEAEQYASDTLYDLLIENLKG